MSGPVYGLAAAVLAASFALTFLMRRIALAHGLLDVPNERSSHQRPTPRGGGVAIAVTATIAFGILALSGRLDFAVFAALSGGIVVALIGFLDDRRPLPPLVRLAAHAAAAVWALTWLGGLPAVRFGDQILVPGVGGFIIGILGIVWVLNLFNFMDGIDGIAASEATFIAWSGALLGAGAAATGGLPAAAAIFGAACLGFLCWNWPPARIFLGDVGSGYCGYVIAVLAVVAGRRDPVALAVWLTLGGAFFTDATVTLVRRALRRERVHAAHRDHAYQELSRRWGSHRRVTLTTIAVNVLWLLPCAWLETRLPGFAALITLLALTVLTAAVLAAGAGRGERRSQPVAGAP